MPKLGYKQSEEHKRKHLEKIVGNKNGRWKNGVYKYDPHYYRRKHRAMKYTAQGGHTNAEWELLKAQYNWTCPCCQRREPEVKLVQDHIIPLSKGGSDNIENIQPLCPKCNGKKYTKSIKY